MHGPVVNIWYSEEHDGWELSLPGRPPVLISFSQKLHDLGRHAFDVFHAEAKNRLYPIDTQEKT